MENLKKSILEHISKIDSMGTSGSGESYATRLLAKSEAYKTLFLVDHELKKG